MKPGNLIPLVVDNFAGGGASTGIEEALGRAVARALVAANQPGLAEIRLAA